MNRREFVRLMALATAAASCSFAVGCSSSENETTDETDLGEACNIALVYASRANSCASLLSSNGEAFGAIRKELESMVKAEGFFAIVLADGSPQSASTTIALESTNETKRRNEVDNLVKEIESTNFTAQSEEADIFKALAKANKEFGKVPEENQLDNMLIVIDSGISTHGVINFTEQATRNALLDPSLLVSKLREEGELSPFDNIDKVLWYGLGSVAEPQGEPTEGAKAAMKNLYRTVFEAAGVDLPEDNKEVFKDGEEVEPSEDLPSVAVVEIPRIPIDENGNPVLIGDNIELDEKTSDLTFTVGSSDFRDPSKAKESLQDYIDQLIDFPSLKATIHGYTDTTGSTTANQALSVKRAEAVKTLFIEAGVNPDQIVAIGEGESDKYDNDEQNRRVEIAFG